jgi:hypothetical protein
MLFFEANGKCKTDRLQYFAAKKNRKMTKTALENFHGNENVKKLKLDNDKEEAAKGQDHRDVSGIDSIKFEQISKNLELSHEEFGQRDGHVKVGLLNGPTENAEDGSQFGGVRSAADMVVVESELVMVESELVARSDISSEEYVPLSAKPLLKIGFEANKKYEEIYLAIQNEKKISKNQSKEEKRNSVKFDKREPGLVKRIPKKKVALLLSYCGTGYNGMQINPNVASIELDLHKALAESGAVLQENAMNPTKNQFMRCARTDKGVKLLITTSQDLLSFPILGSCWWSSCIFKNDDFSQCYRENQCLSSRPSIFPVALTILLTNLDSSMGYSKSEK